MSNRTLMRFTGVGGQGVLLAGEIFAAAKISNGGFGLKTATYTSQVRGGPTVVDITLQDEEIIYPYANDGEIDFMLSVAQISFDLFKNGVKDGATIVIEPNLVHPSEEDKKRWNIIEIPIITIAGSDLGNILTGSVLVESVFSIPGIGKMLVDSINTRDLPIVQGGVMYIAVICVIMYLVVDLLYTVVDPRIRLGKESS